MGHKKRIACPRVVIDDVYRGLTKDQLSGQYIYCSDVSESDVERENLIIKFRKGHLRRPTVQQQYQIIFYYQY